MTRQLLLIFLVASFVAPGFATRFGRASQGAQGVQGRNTPEYFFTRLIYPSGGGGFGGFRRGGRSWATDYPEADYKFMWGVKRMTNISVFPNENAVDVLDPKLFDFPYLYIVEPGRGGGMFLSPQQVKTLREYLDRGGFLHIDDFWGLYEFSNFEREMRKLFSDRPLKEIPLTHEIFHTFFDVDQVMQIPGIGSACNGGPTWQDPSDTRPRIFGISDDNGRLMVVVTYNSDLGDAWEHMDNPCYPELYSGQAYRMGINFIVYSMSH
jgi:Domain of unknown function (DUF4159)